MKDFELNIAIAEALYPDARTIERYAPAGDRVFIIRDNQWDTVWDYCNRWQDLMPLVVEYDYSIKTVGGITKVVLIYSDPKKSSYNTFISNDENPQRALAECVLKVLESK